VQETQKEILATSNFLQNKKDAEFGTLLFIRNCSVFSFVLLSIAEVFLPMGLKAVK
jgi:hypothetical protein